MALNNYSPWGPEKTQYQIALALQRIAAAVEHLAAQAERENQSAVKLEKSPAS